MLQAMWVHGNVVVPERTASPDVGGPDGPLTDLPGVPWSSKVGFRQGWGATFRGKDGQNNWFHLPIPTPVIQEDERANLLRVFLLYITEPDVSVTDVHVWDGPNRIFTSDPLTGTSGDHRDRLIDEITKWHIRTQPAVDWGINLSVRVRFSDMGNITFVSAGADFDVTPGRR